MNRIALASLLGLIALAPTPARAQAINGGTYIGYLKLVSGDPAKCMLTPDQAKREVHVSNNVGASPGGKCPFAIKSDGSFWTTCLFGNGSARFSGKASGRQITWHTDRVLDGISCGYDITLELQQSAGG